MTDKDNSSKVLTLTDMLASELQRDEVDCPEWGGIVYVQELTAANRTAMTKKLTDGRGGMDWNKIDQFAPFLLVHGVLNPDGHLYLSNDDAKKLCQASSSKVVDRIAKAIAALSGLTKEAQTEKVKNSLTVPTDDSPSD